VKDKKSSNESAENLAPPKPVDFSQRGFEMRSSQRKHKLAIVITGRAAPASLR
jgi:hypothetical protein